MDFKTGLGEGVAQPNGGFGEASGKWEKLEEEGFCLAAAMAR